MDVVRTNVERLSGSVVVESEIGVGTTFRLTLPLTLAIVQTMMVGLGDDTYAIPLASIIDSLYLNDVTVSTVKGYPVIQWRDQVLPLLYLRSFYSHRRLQALSSNGYRQGIITVAWGKLRLGLVVDHIVGKQEIVVKSFSPIIGQIPGLSGCTILGDGSIALIMDIPGLVNATTQERR
jgi:two-component system chemotaxis sensor kinase CheA